MEDERITLRMGTDEVQHMDSYLLEHPELGTRSLFIRTAVREYINRDAGVSVAQKTSTGKNAERDVCVSVSDGREEMLLTLSKRQADMLRAEAEKGLYDNEGQVLKSLIKEYFVTPEKARQEAAETYERTDPNVFKR